MMIGIALWLLYSFKAVNAFSTIDKINKVGGQVVVEGKFWLQGNYEELIRLLIFRIPQIDYNNFNKTVLYKN